MANGLMPQQGKKVPKPAPVAPGDAERQKQIDAGAPSITYRGREYTREPGGQYAYTNPLGESGAVDKTYYVGQHSLGFQPSGWSRPITQKDIDQGAHMRWQTDSGFSAYPAVPELGSRTPAAAPGPARTPRKTGLLPERRALPDVEPWAEVDRSSMDERPGLVSDRLGTLLDSDSPYLDRARTRARQFANRRGLMSSSIAAGAGEAAAIDAALPIAQADAGLEFQDIAQRRSIGAQEHLARKQRDLADVINRRNIMAQELMQQRGLSHAAAQAEANRALQRDLESARRELQSSLAAATREQTRQISVQSGTQHAMDAYRLALTAIQNNPNIPADERARMLANAEHQRDQQLNLLEQVHNVDLDWTQAQPGEMVEEEAA